MLKKLPEIIRLTKKNMKFLNSFRKHKRETWDDLFNKLRKKVERRYKKK